MLDQLREITKRLASDPSVVVSAIYRIDGTPIVTFIKDKKYISILEWLESQTKLLLNLMAENSLKSVDFKTRDYVMIIYPLSGSLVLVVISTSEASVYKLRIDVESLKRILNV
ncbi:MAG: hypothetical protein LM574_02500 [Archaeoglobus sp.]|jgi:hypothetical protein|nr:hypothetical protein [Archaeoglobus sp.]